MGAGRRVCQEAALGAWQVLRRASQAGMVTGKVTGGHQNRAQRVSAAGVTNRTGMPARNAECQRCIRKGAVKVNGENAL